MQKLRILLKIVYKNIKLTKRLIFNRIICDNIKNMNRVINNVIVCGIGAVGSIYADKIRNYVPQTLRILVDEKRLERYTREPIIFNGRELNFNYILPSAADFKADLIIIATKFDGLNEAVENIRNFVKQDTIILSLLNGVTSEDIIAQKYGEDKVLYSYFIGHSAVRTGRYVEHDDYNILVFGAKNGIDKRVIAVKEFLEQANIKYEIPDDIKYSLWRKFMLNISSNQPSAILNMTFGQMQKNKKFLLFAQNIMTETAQIAKAEGVNNSENLIKDGFEALSMMCPEGKTSMLQDVEAGRKTEVDMFAGTVIELGKKHGIPTPYNKILYEMIQIIHENQNLSKNSECAISV